MPLFYCQILPLGSIDIFFIAFGYCFQVVLAYLINPDQQVLMMIALLEEKVANFYVLIKKFPPI